MFLKNAFKGTLTRDFRPLVFSSHQTPPRPLIHGYGFEFAKKIDNENNDFGLSGVNGPAVTKTILVVNSHMFCVKVKDILYDNMPMFLQ
jgi:hypothetical protein